MTLSREAALQLGHQEDVSRSISSTPRARINVSTEPGPLLGASYPTPQTNDELSTILGASHRAALEGHHSVSSSPPLSPHMEQNLLDEYRTKMNGHFPFVVLPAAVNAESIRQTRPLLFKVCVAVACHHNLIQQQKLSQDVLQYIYEHMLLMGEKSLDLLQGLLVLIAWYGFSLCQSALGYVLKVMNNNNTQSGRYHCSSHLHKPQLMNLVHLAMALLVDLGLNRTPHMSDQVRMSSDTDQLLYGKMVASGPQTNEERRALLGCFHLTSTYVDWFPSRSQELNL